MAISKTICGLKQKQACLFCVKGHFVLLGATLFFNGHSRQTFEGWHAIRVCARPYCRFGGISAGVMPFGFSLAYILDMERVSTGGIPLGFALAHTVDMEERKAVAYHSGVRSPIL